jgi:hypothetical protein
MHTALVSRLMKDRSAWELANVPVAEAQAEEPESSELTHNLLSRAALQGA